MTTGHTKNVKSRRQSNQESVLSTTSVPTNNEIAFSTFVKQHPMSSYIQDMIYHQMLYKTPVIVGGADIGQGGSKFAVQMPDGSYLKHYIPSIMSHKRYTGNSSIVQGTSRQTDDAEKKSSNTLDTYYFSYDTKHIAYGKEAAFSGSTSIHDRRRYVEDPIQTGLITMAIWAMQQLHPDKYEGIFYLTTHVPMDVYNEIHEEVIRTHTRDYNVTYHTPSGDINYLLHIAILEVLVEGTGAAIAYGPDAPGQVAVHDVGRGTDDHIIYDDDLFADADRSFNDNIGVGEIEKRFRELVGDTYGRSLSPKEMLKCLDGYKTFTDGYGYYIDSDSIHPTGTVTVKEQAEAKTYIKYLQEVFPSIHVGHENGHTVMMDQVQLYIFLRQASTEIGNRLFSVMRSHLGQSIDGKIGQEMLSNIWVGGMVFFIYHIIAKNMHNVFIPPFPQYGNAFGLASRADARYDRDIKGAM